MEPIFWVRFGFALMVLGGLALAVRRQRQVVELLRVFFFEPSIPQNLGILRLFVFGVLLQHAITSPAEWYTTLPLEFRDLPRGWPSVEQLLPGMYREMHWIVRALVVTAALATVGALTRVTTIVASVLSVIVFAVPNFYFKIGHGMQVPTLSALVLAVSPCGDAVSVDAMVRERRGLPRFAPSAAYTIPVRFSWLLLSTMYLFPGLWKLWESGDLWIDGSKLKYTLFGKWGELPAFYPALRVDHHPAVLSLFGIGTLVLEVGFVVAVFNRKARIVAALSAAAFHIGIGFTMQIWFDFWIPLVLLVDVPGLFDVGPLRAFTARVPPMRRWLERMKEALHAPGAAKPADSGAAPFVAGSVLLFAMCVAGLAPVDSFPVAVYPRFHSRNNEVPTTGSAFEFALKGADGVEKPLRAEFQPIEDTAGVFRLVRATIDFKRQRKEALLRRNVALIARIIRENNAAVDTRGATLVVYRFEFPIEPEERKKVKAHARSLVAEVPL